MKSNAPWVGIALLKTARFFVSLVTDQRRKRERQFWLKQIEYGARQTAFGSPHDLLVQERRDSKRKSTVR
jgi:hypothetical protein